MVEMVSDQNVTVGSFELHVEKVKNDLYGIYREYMLKRMTSEDAVKGIINYITDINNHSKVVYTKHLISLLVRLVVKLIIKINPKHPIFYKFLESNIIDAGLTNPTRYYLYHIIEIYFPTKIEGIQKYVLRVLPSFFPANIEFDAIEVIKAGLHGFLFQTYKTLSSYFSLQFKWNYNFNGFSSDTILIIKKNTDPYIEESFSAEYTYGAHKDWEREIKNGKKHFFICKNFSIQILQIGFALQIYKLIVNNFYEKNLAISFSNNDDIPVKVSYKDNDILLYFFASPSRNHDAKPLPKGKKEKKRIEAIDLDWFVD